MKLEDAIKQTRKTLLLAPIIILGLVCILRIHTFRQECLKLETELAELNKLEAQKNTNAAPALFIESRQNGNSQWSANGLVVHPHQNFQIKVSFWNNLEITCSRTKLEGITRSKRVEMIAGGRYYDTKGGDYTCVLNADDNEIQLFKGDQSPHDVFFFEQTYNSKVPIFGKKDTAVIQYIVSNDHFVTTANYYIGYVPFLSWTEIILFVAAVVYILTAILWETYDLRKDKPPKNNKSG